MHTGSPASMSLLKVSLLSLFVFGIVLHDSWALIISKPRQSDFVLLESNGGMQVEVNLGRLIVPVHGNIAIFIDDHLSAVFCPEFVTSLAHCPKRSTQTTELKGAQVPLRITGVIPGERVLTVQIVDATNNTVEEISLTFWATERNEDDLEFLAGCSFSMIIFSKDRACQLDQLLSSMEAHIANFASPQIRVQVLYTYSAKEYRKAYEQVMALHKAVIFHQEGNITSDVTSPYFEAYTANGGSAEHFKAQYLRLLDPEVPYTMHYVDDIVMIREWGLQHQLLAHRILNTRPEVLTHSLRLHPGITECYATNQRTPPPDLDSEMTWLWKTAQGDWGYPMSLDAHIFRTFEIADIALNIQFTNPNTYELGLAMHCIHEGNTCAPRMSCYDAARIINIPANLIQTVFVNRHMENGPSPCYLRSVRYNDIQLIQRIAICEVESKLAGMQRAQTPLRFARTYLWSYLPFVVYWGHMADDRECIEGPSVDFWGTAFTVLWGSMDVLST